MPIDGSSGMDAVESNGDWDEFLELDFSGMEVIKILLFEFEIVVVEMYNNMSWTLWVFSFKKMWIDMFRMLN